MPSSAEGSCRFRFKFVDVDTQLTRRREQWRDGVATQRAGGSSAEPSRMGQIEVGACKQDDRQKRVGITRSPTAEAARRQPQGVHGKATWLPLNGCFMSQTGLPLADALDDHER